MTYANWQQAMHALVRGKIRKMVEGGLELRYEGNVMGPDMAAGCLFPALLCLADEFAQDSGMEAFGAGYFIQQDGIVVEVEKSPLASWTAPFGTTLPRRLFSSMLTLWRSLSRPQFCCYCKHICRTCKPRNQMEHPRPTIHRCKNVVCHVLLESVE